MAALSPSLYIGEGRSGRRPRERGGHRGNPRWVWAPPPPRKLAPEAGRGGCPRGGAPTSPGYVRGVGRGAQPLSGLVCPLPLAHKAPNACRGLRNTFRSRWSSPGTPRTIPESNSLRPIYRSSPPDHSGVPRHVRDLIRNSEQPSVTTYYFP